MSARTRSQIPHTPRIATLALLAAGGWGATGLASAAEFGTVLSSTAVTAQTAVPMQECRDEQALVQPRNSGGGALLGALIGGVIGNQVGAGFGRAAATGLGVVAGAAIGDNAEAGNNPPVASTVRRCQTFSRTETRLVGYDVVYDYRGQRYSTRLAQDPGERVALDVQVTPAGALAAAPVQTVQQVQQIQQVVEGVQPAVVYQQAPIIVSPGYYGGYGGYGGYYGYGPAASLVIGVGSGGGHGGGHWRQGHGHGGH